MINNMVLQPDGYVLISGETSKIENVRIEGLSRIDSLGAPDSEFTAPVMGHNDSVFAIHQYGDRSIVVGGQFTTATATTTYYLVGLDPDGLYDPHDNWFRTHHLDGKVMAFCQQEDGQLLVGGEFTNFDDSGANALVRVTEEGEIDPNFETALPPHSGVHTIAVQTDGKILVGGNFSFSDEETTHKNLVRLHVNGQLDTDFNEGTDDWVFSMLLMRNGQIVVGGVFKQVAGIARKYLARLNADGSPDEGFSPDLGLLGWVYSIVEQDDGKLIIGGEFTSVDDVQTNHLARLNTDGSLDQSLELGSGANESVKVITLQTDGKILLGGEFSEYNRERRKHVARLNPDGSLDRGFGDDR